MALASATVWEVRTAGNDTNGGGFVTGASGSDWSQQDAARTGADVTDISVTDAVAAGTTTITSATANFDTTIVGNIVYFEGGTGAIAAVWRQVTARASSTSITIDAAIASSTGMTMNIGGALASPGMAGASAVSGNTIYIKAGTYTITSASTNISGGCFAATTSKIIEGYQTTRGDLGTKPLLQASGISTFTLVSCTGAASSVKNIRADGAGLTSSKAFTIREMCFNCVAENCTNGAFTENIRSTWNRCVATGCSTVAPFLTGMFIDCIAHDNTVTGFSMTSNDIVLRCISDSNSGASSDGFSLSLDGGVISNCVAYNNGRDGIRISDDGITVENCIAEGNAGTGILLNGAIDNALLIHNATYNNTTAGINVGTGKGVLNLNPVAGSASFFTDAAGADFTLNNTAGGGAAARGAGYPGTMPS